MKTLKSLILVFIVITGTFTSRAQQSPPETIDKQIAEGNKLLNSGKFNQALLVWLKVLKEDVENANANFKLGLCYKKSMDKQSKAALYFRKASKNMTERYSFFNVKEKKAPVDVLYFLGEAYMAADEPDSALLAFMQYKDKFDGNTPIEVESKIRTCINAQKMINKPLQIKYKNIGSIVNSGYYDAHPVPAVDNTFLFFSSRRLRADNSNKEHIELTSGKYYEDIYFSKKDGKGEWEAPVFFEHNSDKNEYPSCIASDGKMMYFCREDKLGDFNIYHSFFKDGVWEKPVKMSGGINSQYNETEITISVDGNHLYFSSDRKQGNGKFDLYHCTKKPNGKWSSPDNLGSEVNTASNETNPFIHPAGKRLYFCSDGHHEKNMGGYDIFYLELNENGTWSAPKNAGYPISSTKDDFSFAEGGEGKRYCSVISDNLDYDLFEIIDGKFDAKNLKPGTVVEIEKDVAEIIEIEKQVEKVVEITEIVEQTVEVEKEVQVTEIVEVEKVDPEVAKAEAEKAKADAEKTKA
ncbi:MAG: hypothetical protein A2275_02725, partial [Bacteroidetes bacterium RIFOXYA12_FULL_35_11]